MEVKYTYKILKVDKQLEVMDVEYTHEEHGVCIVAMHIPHEGEDLENTINQYSPYYLWYISKIPKLDIKENQTGNIKTSFQLPNEVIPVNMEEQYYRAEEERERITDLVTNILTSNGYKIKGS